MLLFSNIGDHRVFGVLPALTTTRKRRYESHQNDFLVPPLRQAQAMQVKLDELIRCTSGAHVALADLDELEDAELGRIRDEYEALATRARQQLHKGISDTGTPRIGNRKKR